MTDPGYRGLLCIGDPHVASRVPGFRSDEYPRAILDKLGWCIDYAREERLLPAILGDLFHWPRDNANWLLGELLELFSGEVLGIAGNHDHRENALGPDDSLSVLARAGRLRLLDGESPPWRGELGDRSAIVGGTPWSERLPERFEPDDDREPLVLWLTHHLVDLPGTPVDRGVAPREIPGIHVVINGHIHTRLDDLVTGATTWLNPGNIARYTRSETARTRIPAALRIDVGAAGFESTRIEIPHRPFDEVFFPELVPAGEADLESAFVSGLAELQARRTDSGAALQQFLDRNLAELDDRVAAVIRELAKEVIEDGR